MKRDHIHLLRRHTYKNGEVIFFCVDDCSFKVGVDLSIGKVTLCWRCGKPFRLESENKRQAKPHCVGCIVKRPGKDAVVEKLTDAIPDNPTTNIRERLNKLIAFESDDKEEML